MEHKRIAYEGEPKKGDTVNREVGVRASGVIHLMSL